MPEATRRRPGEMVKTTPFVFIPRRHTCLLALYVDSPEKHCAFDLPGLELSKLAVGCGELSEFWLESSQAELSLCIFWELRRF